jgi:NADH-quinone oxidoreductase subunit F
MSRIASPEALKTYREELKKARPQDQPVIAICNGTGCAACGSGHVVAAFKEELTKQGLQGKVRLRATGCQGFCERSTLVQFLPEGVLYQRITAEDVPEIVEKTVKGGEYLEKHFYENPATGEKVKFEKDIPFYMHQNRYLIDKILDIEPTSIDDYIAIGGYGSLAKAFELGADNVLDEIKKSELRGRGGGGFLAGRKWETCRNVQSDKRYIICNANEGDPGEFIDRFLMEGNPNAIIEGMIIGAFTIGSDEGYIYIQKDYRLAIERLEIAMQQARDKGFLGENILGTGLNFDMKITKGGGAFVCGESTALMRSIEGKPGEPRAKHIHTVESGLNAKPSNLNNVETWANVPLIIEKGADWYAAMGTKGSTGTKILSITGKVVNSGMVEVPLGTTLRQLIYDMGGGVADGKEIKAVLKGGPSGGCFSKEKLDLSVDYDTLWEEGSMMGGGVIVLDEDTCMVDVDKHALNFLKLESCGKCTSCREGLRRLHEIVTEISEGRGTEESIKKMEKIAKTVESTSLCALGTTATNPLRSTLKFFREEYEAHIKDKTCPAGVCNCGQKAQPTPPA